MALRTNSAPARRGRDTSAIDTWTGFDRLTSALLGDWPARAGLLPSGFTPLADVEETDDAYLVEVELPGVSREDVSVEQTGGRLVVHGERKERERVGILRRRTRTTGRFYYEVDLPAELDDQAVTASLDRGVLTVRVPKSGSARRRRIPVH